MVPQAILGIVGLWTALRPCETSEITGVLLAASVLGLLPWALKNTSFSAARGAIIGAAGVVLLAGASAASGCDRASAITQITLAGVVAVLIWYGSRTPPSPRIAAAFALGISLLGVWAIWQVAAGFEIAAGGVPDLPVHLQRNAAERLASGRAFASLLLPGHLAALLASALPLLVARVRRRRSSIGWVIGCLLCVVGLLLTQSPVGVGLAVLAVIAAVAGDRRRVAMILAGVLVAGMVAAFAFRSDLAALKPLQLRVDNWRTAAWVWSSAPVTGVGLGSYGQASRAVPFDVGNQPAHAHSLPLEWVAEMGLVGAMAAFGLAVALCLLVTRLWRVRRDLAVAIAVIPLHNLVDFSLYTSGVAIPWAILFGWGLAEVRRPSEGPDASRLRLFMVAAATVALGFAVLHATASVVERSARFASSPEERFSMARRARDLAPWRLSPVWLCGAAAVESGRVDLAKEGLEVLADSRWLRPRAASLWGYSSQLRIIGGDLPGALADAWEAREAQPSVALHAEYFDQLLARLQAMDNDRIH